MSAETTGREFLEQARERRFDGHRLKALRDLVGGLGGLLGGLSIGTIDSPDDLGAVADRFGPMLTWAAKFTPTTLDDQALAFILAALKNSGVQQVIYALLFGAQKVSPESSDDDLLDALQSAALAIAA